MKELFLGFAVVSFFGSLSRFTPNTPWSDWSYLYRKNKKGKNKEEYIKFSNIFRGNYLLIVGLVSLIFSVLSSFVTFEIEGKYIFIIYAVCLSITELILQVKWNNHVKYDKLI